MMKKVILSILTILTISIGLNAQIVTIPDANFKAYLVGNSSINTNGDAEIQISEATAYTSFINVNSLSISDLTGIEAFTNITQLYCSGNSLTSIDGSNNTALETLSCDNNALTSLNLSSNTMLENLYCDNNQLTSLDLSNLAMLIQVDCYLNQLTFLNVTNNTSLEKLYCYSNQLVNLDLSSNTSLIYLSCGDNLLTSLNVANGNNTNMDGGANPSLYALNNPNLICIQIDAGYSPNSFDWRVDAIASYSTNCGTPSCTVNIPDANFKSYLVGNTAINTNGDSEIQCSEASSYTGGIFCSSLSISDLTGIEAFTSINNLTCSNNNLTTLNIDSNTSLQTLYCNGNQLTSLNTSNNPILSNLRCHVNAITSLDLSTNLDLRYIYCYDNQITSIILPQSAILEELTAEENILTSIDLTFNTGLELIDLDDNQLSTIDLSQNTLLESLYLRNNLFTSLDCSFNTVLDWIVVNDNPNLETLDVSNGNNTNVGFFWAHNSPNLTCIQVDDVTYSNSNWVGGSFNFDAASSFNLSCVATPVLVSSISVQGTGGVSTITTQGGTLQMEAAVLPANATDDSYFWSVVNGTGSATLDANGLLTATGDGTVEVTATANDGSGVTGTTTITISNQNPAVLVSSIVVQGSGGVTTISTNGGTLQMFATVFPGSADDATYTWSVANGTGSATISAAGLLTASADGTVTVTATANDASGVTGALDITISNQTTAVVLVSSIDVQGTGGVSTIATQGGTLQMTVSILPMNANDASYVWSVTNGTGSASIDANGLLTAAADGTVEVIATANDASGVTGTKTITISNQTVGIRNVAFDNIVIYPNPTSAFVNLDINEELSSIRLMDLTGTTVKVFNAQMRQFDVAEFTSGIYFLEIANSERKSIIKVIKK